MWTFFPKYLGKWETSRFLSCFPVGCCSIYRSSPDHSSRASSPLHCDMEYHRLHTSEENLPFCPLPVLFWWTQLRSRMQIVTSHLTAPLSFPGHNPRFTPPTTCRVTLLVLRVTSVSVFLVLSLVYILAHYPPHFWMLTCLFRIV